MSSMKRPALLKLKKESPQSNRTEIVKKEDTIAQAFVLYKSRKNLSPKPEDKQHRSDKRREEKLSKIKKQNQPGNEFGSSTQKKTSRRRD